MPCPTSPDHAYVAVDLEWKKRRWSVSGGGRVGEGAPAAGRGGAGCDTHPSPAATATTRTAASLAARKLYDFFSKMAIA